MNRQEYRRVWASNNKEKIKAQYLRWYAKKGKKRYQDKKDTILANNKKWRDSEKGKAYVIKKYEREPHKILARKLLRAEVRKGNLKRLPCIKCGNLKTHGHHTDYSKPLTVVWLCQIHHSELHHR